MQFGIIGSGSWATALAKILTDNGNTINWWVRNTDTIAYMHNRRHNPRYVSTAFFNTAQLKLSDNIMEVVAKSDVVVIAVPSAFAEEVLEQLPTTAFENKKIVSAIKGILPTNNLLLNDYLKLKFNVALQYYYSVLGPCHAEEVAAEKLSYLTFSGLDEQETTKIASHFKTEYINTVVNQDILGVQYAAVLKNIYALGAGIAHGLEYGDNFLSVYIANCSNEMENFLRKLFEQNKFTKNEQQINYNASVYLGDLLVTCYSLYSRNRTFGAMIGKGYSVTSAQFELNMIAEGYNASKCIYLANKTIQANMPIATAVYNILWQNDPADEAFKAIEKLFF